MLFNLKIKTLKIYLPVPFKDPPLITLIRRLLLLLRKLFANLINVNICKHGPSYRTMIGQISPILERSFQWTNSN